MLIGGILIPVGLTDCQVGDHDPSVPTATPPAVNPETALDDGAVIVNIFAEDGGVPNVSDAATVFVGSLFAISRHVEPSSLLTA